jgi:D-alanyl-lipoteichoic acid acyltransferase DltB (MBOAT superfamily)
MDWLYYIEKIFLFDKEAPLIFTRFYFWAFFAIVLFFYSFLHKTKNKTIRSAYLFLVSLFFYWKSSGFFFFILLFSTVTDFHIGKAIYNSRSDLRSKLLIALSVFINLTVLVYFKYAYFFTDSFNQMFNTNFEVINYLAQWSNEGFGTHFTVDKILLPVGISFYTFQTISYSVDVYRKEIKPVNNLIDFGFYVSFFPQLVAGPIVRARDFVPQLYEEYKVSRYEFGLAIFWILKGLVKKVFIGDYIAVNFVDRVFAAPLSYSGFENLMALFGYSLQVYVDFSGYTDMAIGVALLMGFRLPTNFNSPYKAYHVSDFWRRWHISLSSWLRDYLYIPMGGNRGGSLFSYIMLSIVLLFVTMLSGVWWLSLVFLGTAALIIGIAQLSPAFKRSINTNINLMLTMLIGGLWHGASWNFVIWGGLNGIGLVVSKFWKKYKMSKPIFFGIINITLLILWFTSVLSQQYYIFLLGLLNGYWLISLIVNWASSKLNPERDRAKEPWYLGAVKIMLTFSFITFTRVFFRSDDMKIVEGMLLQIGGDWDFSLIGDMIVGYKWVFGAMALGLIFHWLPYKTKDAYRNWFINLPHWAQVIITAIVVIIVYQSISADMQAFIYFQF